MNKIRVGVVGLGHLGFKQAENSTTTKNASLIVVCDHSEEELKKVKEKINLFFLQQNLSNKTVQNMLNLQTMIY